MLACGLNLMRTTFRLISRKSLASTYQELDNNRTLALAGWRFFFESRRPHHTPYEICVPKTRKSAKSQETQLKLPDLPLHSMKLEHMMS